MFSIAMSCEMVVGQQIVDRIVAVVGTDVITLSEAEHARRVRLLREDDEDLDLTHAVERLIERSLIEREVRRNPDREGDENRAGLAEQSLARIRDSFVSPSAYHDALQAHQMREGELLEELARQHAVSGFLERRFRALIYVTQEEIADYYREEIAPEVEPELLPGIEEVADRIERLLEERKFNDRVESWIEDLKSRATVRRYVW